MKTELTMLAWSAALCVLLVLPYAIGFARTVGLAELAGNRENFPAGTGWIGRARRAHANMIENLVPFAALVLAVVVAGRSSGTTALAAELFLAGRVVHAVAYIAGIGWVRTLGFAAGVVAMAMLFAALVG
jgi:uncharacterized MAPEG superfamily protein